MMLVKLVVMERTTIVTVALLVFLADLDLSGDGLSHNTARLVRLLIG